MTMADHDGVKDDDQLEDLDKANLEVSDNDDDETEDEDDGEVVISIGDAAAPAANGDEEEAEHIEAPKWVKEVRNENRELKRQLKELQKKEAPEVKDPEAPVLGDKPKLADFEYDEDLYQTAVDTWYAKKTEVESYQAQQTRKQEEAKQAQQKVMDDYQAASKKLRVPDFKDAEDVVADTLSRDQQGLILNGAEDPAKLIYALGKSPEKLKEIAAIANPVKFAFAVSKLERDIKMTKRDKPNPETPMTRTGSASRATSVDKTMERLEEEADKTGDRSKIIAYRAELRKKGIK